MNILYFIIIIPIAILLYHNKNQQDEKMNSLRKHILLGNGKRKAVLIGATGATGSQVLKILLNSPEWGRVTTFGRRELPKTNNEYGKVDSTEDTSKLQHHIVNFDKLNENDDKTISLFKDHDVVFNCIGTTRGQAGGADPFYKIEVEYTQKIATIASKAGIKQFSVVSAQGANPNQYYVKWIHPLLYMYTLGMKEEVVKNVTPPFQRISIFRPGMLNRLKEDRTAEIIINRVFGGLRVDALAKCIVKDAESDKHGSSNGVDDDNNNTVVIEEPIIYEGNDVILSQSQL